MKLKDLNGDCTGCPLIPAHFCNGGFRCYGGAPIEPPCCDMDEDTDLDEWVEEADEKRRAYERRLESKEREERLKRERAAKAAETRRAMRYYCISEISALKRAEKALRRQKDLERMASSLAQAMNITNEMFRYEERVKVRPEISDEVQRLEKAVAKCKEDYDRKRKEFYTQRKSSARE